MAELITDAGRQLLAQHQGSGTALVIDTFVLAYHAGQLPGDAIDPATGYPDAGDIVYQAPVTQAGYSAPDMVIYSLLLGETVGPFTFNTVYCVASGESNAVVMVITLPDTPKIATDVAQGIRGQSMIRNAVLVYNGAQAITQVNVEAAAWQFAFQNATEDARGWAEIATQAEVDAGTDHSRIVTPKTLGQRMSGINKGFVGQLFYFSTPTLPAGFPGFVCNGSTVVNGVNDFPELAASGSGWITVSGSNLVIHDAADFIRGKGSSGRAVGALESDAIRNVTGRIGHIAAKYIGQPTPAGAFYTVANNFNSAFGYSGEYLDLIAAAHFDASRVVPTAAENRPKSKTALIAIYHGVIV